VKSPLGARDPDDEDYERESKLKTQLVRGMRRKERYGIIGCD